MNDNQKDDEMSVIKEEHEFKDEGPSIDTQTNLLTPEQIEEFFKATEDGSIERLEQLFNEKIDADPNMTYFTESLLMAAIRRNQNEIADYLIDQLAVNVQYAADLQEFRLRSRAPVRHRTFSCRDLAYEKGMMELVDLIDLTSKDVTQNIKRYLKIRLQTRLYNIHQAYLKRVEERKLLLFELNKEKENIESPTVNQTDENIIPSSSSSMLPSINHRPYKSHIEETIQNINTTTKDKSIDETGKKIFRFSNYTLRFRLVETPNIKNNEQIPLKTTMPTLPTISLFTSTPTPSLTTENTHRSISVKSSRISTQEIRKSACRSARRPILTQILHTENKPPLTTSTQRLLPKRVQQNNIKYKYISQPHVLYNQSQRFMPVTLKSNVIGLPSNTRFIRD